VIGVGPLTDYTIGSGYAVYNGDCVEVMNHFMKNFVDLIITSPFYNMGKNPNHGTKGSGTDSLYNEFKDNMTIEEYYNFMYKVFTLYEQILVRDGVILWNMSYSSKNAILPYQIMHLIHENTEFTVRDTIVWKKAHATSFQTSPNNLSRICELIFVIARKDVVFKTNKQKGKYNETTKQQFYKDQRNFIKTHGTRQIHKNIKHKATFPLRLVYQLLEIYAQPGAVVMDNFMGLGTTGRACKNKGFDFIGIGDDKMTEKELHENQDAELEAERQSMGYYDPYVSKYGTEYKQMKDAY